MLYCITKSSGSGFVKVGFNTQSWPPTADSTCTPALDIMAFGAVEPADVSMVVPTFLTAAEIPNVYFYTPSRWDER